MKGKNLLKYCVLSSAILVTPLFPKFAFADSLNDFTTDNGNKAYEIFYDLPEEFSIENDIVDNQSVMKPFYIPYDETVYEPSSKYKSVEVTYRSEANNRSSLSDSVTRTVSRDTYVKGGVSTSADFKLITSGVSVTADIGFGKSKTVSVSHTWSIPAHTKTTIKFGSKVMTTRGNIVRYSRGLVSSRKPTDATYTYTEYSDKSSVKIK